MAKKLIFLGFLMTFALSACGQTNVTPSTSDNGGSGSTGEPDMSTVCAGMCDSIQRTCADDIANGDLAGRNMADGILDETSCLLMCEADWDDTVLNCVSAADDCSQFMDSAPYCMETEDDNEEADENPTTANSCDAACNQYSKCAAYTEGVGQKDIDDAYDSCLQICGTWTDSTRQCIASTAINDVSDCAAQTACMFGSIENMQNIQDLMR